jgi:TonB-dependent receptor
MKRHLPLFGFRVGMCLIAGLCPRRLLSFTSLLMAIVGVSAFSAQPAATGSIEGRVLDASRGQYLRNARVKIEGSSQETLTDSAGQYRLSQVQPGPIKLSVFFTGLPVQSEEVSVAAGQVVRHDIRLRAAGPVVVLSDFVVSSSREMDASAIAINERRFSANIKNVVSADEFGPIVDGSVSEFMKFLPGVTLEQDNVLGIAIDGVASGNVPISVGGFELASATAASRSVEIDQLSINNLARIEVLHSPTPEIQGSALAGSVNIVPRGAFERSRPVFTSSIFLMMPDNERDFQETPGPVWKPTRKVHPGFDFSYVAPVTPRFGYTVSGGHSVQYTAQPFSTNTWRGLSAATTGTAFPHTTPDKPYLTSYSVRDGGQETTRYNVSASVDYRLSDRDWLSASVLYSFYKTAYAIRTLSFVVNQVNPGDFSPTWTHGARGAGEISQTNTTRPRPGTTFMPTLVYRHHGPTWQSEAGASYSQARIHFRDMDQGAFANVTSRRRNVTVAFDDIFYLRPGRIAVSDGTTGAEVDPYDLGNYVLISGNSNWRRVNQVKRTAYAWARREFNLAGQPAALKGGLDIRHTFHDNSGANPNYNFVGADGRASNSPAEAGSDDNARVVRDASSSQRVAPFGFPKIEWVSNAAFLDLYRANPNYFTHDAAAAYRTEASLWKRSDEVVSATYLRGDISFFRRRLKLVGGIRAEQTNVHGQGSQTDPTLNFQRNAAGDYILGSNGRPLPISTNALEVAQRTYLFRAAHARKEYLRLFPSLNASFALRENLIARAAVYASVGRPNFNQYAGGLTLPDTELPPSASNQISVPNVGIKAWSAQTVKLRLEHYFEGVGQVSVGVFRRNFEDFFGTSVFHATRAFLALYDLDPDLYSAYNVSTQQNLTDQVRMEGVELDYSQALTFLPAWARGVRVFANGNLLRAIGPGAANFAGYTPRSARWGVSLSRERYSVRANWSYSGRRRGTAVAAGSSIEPGTYNWSSKRLEVDLYGEYRVSPRLALFANVRNLLASPLDTQIEGPSTPDHAQFRSRGEVAGVWFLGAKSSF